MAPVHCGPGHKLQDIQAAKRIFMPHINTNSIITNYTDTLMLINTEQRYSDEGGETQPRLCDHPPPQVIISIKQNTKMFTFLFLSVTYGAPLVT